MTTDDLYIELNKRGHFPLVVITTEDLIEHFAQEEKPITAEQAQKACQFLSDNWEDGSEFMAALEWAADWIDEGKV